MRISDVARDSGLSCAMLALLYKEAAQKVDLKAIDKLCLLFECQVGKLLELKSPAQFEGLRAKGKESLDADY